MEAGLRATLRANNVNCSDDDDAFSFTNPAPFKKGRLRVFVITGDAFAYLREFDYAQKVWHKFGHKQWDLDWVKYNPDTGRFEKPKHKYNGRKPAIFIFCDDIQSSQLVGDRKFRNFVIKHRHIGAFENGEPPIGCSMIIAVQNYTTQGNEGLPKAIRGNANCVAVWKTGNVKELDLLATELSGQIPKKDILDAYEYAMNKEPGNRHNFLFIDLTPKKEHPSPFRFNYNEWILP
ncbi:unnamed protein product [Bathycoccus prasinos]